MEQTYKKHTKKEDSWRKRKHDLKKSKESQLIEEAKKFKKHEDLAEHSITAGEIPDTKETGISYTVSIALPGSILDNAQSLELRTYLAGQIARAAAIFQVDEIIIFDEKASLTKKEFEALLSGQESLDGKKSDCNAHLMKILQFLECPQYLRKRLFPLQKDLKFAGLLNPLDCLHHFRSDDLTIPYREGVVLSKPTKSGKGAYCDAGLSKEVLIDQSIESGIRVTIKLETTNSESTSKHHLRGQVVSPSEPTACCGHYWGYNVRLARCISDVSGECPFPDGYDLKIGTSEKGRSIDSLEALPNFKHLLITFGGVSGLETCVENDQSISDDDPSKLFMLYLNTCPHQGSRTIRTEEAILITMSALRPRIVVAGSK